MKRNWEWLENLKQTFRILDIFITTCLLLSYLISLKLNGIVYLICVMGSVYEVLFTFGTDCMTLFSLKSALRAKIF